MEPIITKQTGNWMTGHIGPFRFEIKRFEEPSVFGIDEGRISKLWLAWKDWYGTGMVCFGIATTGYGDHSMKQAQRALHGLECAIELVKVLTATA